MIRSRRESTSGPSGLFIGCVAALPRLVSQFWFGLGQDPPGAKEKLGDVTSEEGLVLVDGGIGLLSIIARPARVRSFP